MPDIVLAQDLSDLEKCGRYVHLVHTYLPPSLPVREGVRKYMEKGIQAIVRDHGDEKRCDAVVARDLFIEEAGVRGFDSAIPLESERNTYILMNDYADWLEGALHLFTESVGHLDLIPSDPVYVDKVPILTGAYQESNDRATAHLFRVTSHFTGPTETHWMKWPELILQLNPEIFETQIHLFRLPAVVRDRLPSPLCLAYAHPMTGRLRVATIKGEKFGPNWKRVARWEMQGDDRIEWPEWREGITRDQCLDSLVRTVRLEHPGDKDYLRDLRRDTAHMLRLSGQVHLFPRLREGCKGCAFWGLCHGEERDRQGYEAISSVSPAAPAAASVSAPDPQTSE